MRFRRAIASRASPASADLLLLFGHRSLHNSVYRLERLGRLCNAGKICRSSRPRRRRRGATVAALCRRSPPSGTLIAMGGHGQRRFSRARKDIGRAKRHIVEKPELKSHIAAFDPARPIWAANRGSFALPPDLPLLEAGPFAVNFNYSQEKLNNITGNSLFCWTLGASSAPLTCDAPMWGRDDTVFVEARTKPVVGSRPE